MFKRNKNPHSPNNQSILNPFNLNYTFNVHISPSHLTISHNFASSIKPKSYFQLYLIKDQHQSSQINQYLNVPIHAKVFQGKIVISNLRFSFTVDCNQDFHPINQFFLRLIQLRTYDFQQDTAIGEYQLDMDDFIRNFKQKQSNYFYQQCVIHSQVYLTYEVFIETSRVKLEELISQKRNRQKQQMKDHILKRLEDKKKQIQSIANSEDQKQIKEVLKAHLTVLSHLEKDKNQSEGQNEINFKHTKLALELEDNSTPQIGGASVRSTVRDRLQVDERDMFSIRSSQIDLREQIQIPEFKGSKIKRKSASLTGQMHGNLQVSNDSMVLRNESFQLLRNQSQLILIDVKQPKANGNNSFNDSVITFNGKNLDTSELSLDNQFEQALRRIIQGQYKVKHHQQRFLPLLEQFEDQSPIKKKSRQTNNKNHNSLNLSLLSEISLNEPLSLAETHKAKGSILLVIIIAIMLCIFLIDDPSFDIFEDENYTVVDDDYLENKKHKIFSKHTKSNKNKQKRIHNNHQPEINDIQPEQSPKMSAKTRNQKKQKENRQKQTTKNKQKSTNHHQKLKKANKNKKQEQDDY